MEHYTKNFLKIYLGLGRVNSVTKSYFAHIYWKVSIKKQVTLKLTFLVSIVVGLVSNIHEGHHANSKTLKM